MHNRLRHLLLAVLPCLYAAAAGAAEITLFEFPDFGGRRITLRGSVPNFDPGGFNDRAASMVIREGYWELCSDAYFRGRCATFGPGASLPWDINDRISSGRRIHDQFPYNAPPAWGASR